MKRVLPSFDRLVRFKLPLALLVISTWLPALSQAHLQDRIVAIVNSELIMLSDVKREFETEQERLSREHRGNDLSQFFRSASMRTQTEPQAT